MHLSLIGKKTINISGKILGQSMKIFEDAALARN